MPKTTKVADGHQRELLLRHQAVELKADVRQLETAFLAQEESYRDLLSAVKRIAPPPPFKFSPIKKGRTQVRLVLFLADWQIGMSVRGEEIQDYNVYNYHVAETRIQRMITKLEHWMRHHGQVYEIVEIVCLGMGDLLDGCIHLDQLMALEFAPPKQAIRAGYLLAHTLNALSAYAPVRYEGLNADNHARLFKKPIAQGRGEWSYNPILHEIARAATERNSKVLVRDHNPVIVDVQVGDHIFLISHGNDVYTWMGIPLYGLQRYVMQEARRRVEAGKPAASYYCFGHWHQQMKWENVIVAPALCGTTPYDHTKGRYSKPGQYVCLVSKHGIFDEMRMDL